MKNKCKEKVIFPFLLLLSVNRAYTSLTIYSHIFALTLDKNNAFVL